MGRLRHIIASDKGYYGGYGLMNIGTHLVNNILHFAGHCRSVSATATTAGRPITPHDVLPSPSGMGFIAGENISATLSFTRGVTATLLGVDGAVAKDMGARLEAIVADDDERRRMVSELLHGLENLSTTFPGAVSNVRGRGLMCAFDCPEEATRDRILERCLAEHVLALACGDRSVRLRPPLTLSSEEAAEGVRRITQAVSSVVDGD